MPDMYLTRKIFTDKSTIGKLVFGSLELYTLEDTVRKRDLDNDDKLEASEKVYGQTAIPAGAYDIYIRDSQRYARPMPYLKDVPLFTGIMIHWGNYPDNTNGCLLVGMSHTVVDKIDESKKAFDLLYPKIAAALLVKTLKIQIIGGYGV